jgi:hypothetical protein
LSEQSSESNTKFSYEEATEELSEHYKDKISQSRTSAKKKYYQKK